MRAGETPAVAAAEFRPQAARGREGFYRAFQDEGGRWWLLDPQGAPFFMRCVHGVRAAEVHVDGALPLDAAARLRSWAFNALGVRGERTLEDDGLPFLASAEFCDAGRAIVGSGLRLPDVFAPDWPKQVAERAKLECEPLNACRALIGWVTDDRLEWANPTPAGRPSMLQLCLSLEPAFAAYHAAWEFVLAHHGGRLENVARAWNAKLPNKEVVRELTRAEEGLGTRGYLRDDAQWTREFARRYFNTTAAALREADPNHLIFGCRFRRGAGAAVLAEAVYPSVDVAMPPWTELPAVHGSPLQPVLADDVTWADGEFVRSVGSQRAGRLTTFERLLRKARAGLDRMARHPAVVGYAWAEWDDEPGEQPPFASGLVHANGTEAREHTELLAQFNLRAESLHRAAL
jgi:hypothetical protein